MAKHKLILDGMMSAKCSCGEWRYVGILSEANKAIRKVFSYHATPVRKVKKVEAKK